MDLFGFLILLWVAFFVRFCRVLLRCLSVGFWRLFGFFMPFFYLFLSFDTFSPLGFFWVGFVLCCGFRRESGMISIEYLTSKLVCMMNVTV